MRLEEILKIINEYDFMNGPGAMDRPDTSGVRYRGGQNNFVPLDDKEPGWPYDSDSNVVMGQPTGPTGMSRGNRPGTDVHGGPLTPYEYERTQDDGEQDRELGEAMGVPSNVAMAYKGGGGMGSSIPGANVGWAKAPPNPKNDEEDSVDLDQFFGGKKEGSRHFLPETPQTEPIANMGQDYLKDQTDEDLESRIDRVWGRDDNENFIDPETSTEPEDIKFAAQLGRGAFSSNPSGNGSARGNFGMIPDSFDPSELLNGNGSAWEDIQISIKRAAPVGDDLIRGSEEESDEDHDQ